MILKESEIPKSKRDGVRGRTLSLVGQFYASGMKSALVDDWGEEFKNIMSAYSAFCNYTTYPKSEFYGKVKTHRRNNQIYLERLD